jgi:hypothetical protein
MDKDGLLVDHGFTIDFGQRAGHCFGCGYEPIELSPKALKDYLEKVLESWRAGRVRRKDDLDCSPSKIVSSLRFVNRTQPLEVLLNDPRYEQIRQEEIRRVESELAAVQARIIGVKTQITCWAPKALPGVK